MISSSTSRSSSRKPDIILKWLTFLQVLNVLDIFLWGRTMKGEGFCQHRSSRQNYFPKSCRWKSSPSSCHSVVIFAEYFIVLFVKNVFVDIWIRFNSRGHDMTNQTIPHHKMVFRTTCVLNFNVYGHRLNKYCKLKCVPQKQIKLVITKMCTKW